MLTVSYLDLLLQSVRLSACLVDCNGVILEVSEGWRHSEGAADAISDGRGVGDNLLGVVFPLDMPSNLHRGLKRVFARQAQCFIGLGSGDNVDRRRQSVIVVALPAPDKSDRSLVLELDASSLFIGEVCTSVVSQDFVRPLREALTDVVRQSIRDEFSVRDGAGFGMQKVPDSIDLVKLYRLTERQMQLLHCLGQGASNAEISQSLGMSLAAVKAQTTAVMRKLDFKNRTQAALFAARLGLSKSS